MKFSTAATSIVLASALHFTSAFSPNIYVHVNVIAYVNVIVNVNSHNKYNKNSALYTSTDPSPSTSKSTSISEFLSADSISPYPDDEGTIQIEQDSRELISPLDLAKRSTAQYLHTYKGQSGASIIYSKLVEHSVQVVNGYSGGAVLPLLDQFHHLHPRHDALKQPPIRWITNSNENSAGHIAEGYAKSAPKLKDGKQPAGVVVATSGPGVTNLITPLQDAICDGVPMVVLCGQAATNAPPAAFQQAPAVDLTRPCTKWSYQIKSAAELPFVMDYAFFIARNGRPGPVFVDLPKDLQNQILDDELIDAFSQGMPLKLNSSYATSTNMNMNMNMNTDMNMNPYDGIVRLAPIDKTNGNGAAVNGAANANIPQYAFHLGLPDQGILFEMNSLNNGIQPVSNTDLAGDEEVFRLDHSPSDDVYTFDAITDEETKDSFSARSKTVQKIYTLLKKAKKPLIIAGQGCNECPAELKQFADAFKIPVATTLHGLGCFDERDDLALNMVGMHGHPTPNYMTQEADMIVCIGSRFDDRITGRLTDFIPEAKKAAKEYRGGIIHVDIRVSEKSMQVKPTFFVHSTGKHFLDVMNEEIRKKRSEDPSGSEANTITQDWLARKKSLETDFPVKVPIFPTVKIAAEESENGGSNVEVDRTKMSAQSVVTELNRQILEKGQMDNCVFSTGVGIHQMVTAQLITWTQPKQMVTSGSLGTMGVALGFVIGCKLANGHKMCIAVDGDGSFNMTFTELKTVAEQKIPIKILILDNESQMMVEYWQRLFHNERYLAVTNTVNPNYGKLADSFGIKNLYVDCEENLSEVMHQFLFEDSDEPVLLHARIEKTPCLPLVAPGAPLQDMILEDTQTDGGFDASAAPS
jgi:acetolactate synthase-1/2/3 large subunit